MYVVSCPVRWRRPAVLVRAVNTITTTTTTAGNDAASVSNRLHTPLVASSHLLARRGALNLQYNYQQKQRWSADGAGTISWF